VISTHAQAKHVSLIHVRWTSKIPLLTCRARFQADSTRIGGHATSTSGPPGVADDYLLAAISRLLKADPKIVKAAMEQEKREREAERKRKADNK